LPVIDTEYFLVILDITAITDFSWFTASGSIPAGRCLPEVVAAQKPNPASGIDPSIDVVILFLGVSAVPIFHDLFNNVLLLQNTRP